MVIFNHQAPSSIVNARVEYFRFKFRSLKKSGCLIKSLYITRSYSGFVVFFYFSPESWSISNLAGICMKFIDDHVLSTPIPRALSCSLMPPAVQPPRGYKKKKLRLHFSSTYSALNEADNIFSILHCLQKPGSKPSVASFQKAYCLL